MDSGQVHTDPDTVVLEGILLAGVGSLEGHIDLAEAVDDHTPVVAWILVAEGFDHLEDRSLFVQRMDHSCLVSMIPNALRANWHLHTDHDRRCKGRTNPDEIDHLCRGPAVSGVDREILNGSVWAVICGVIYQHTSLTLLPLSTPVL